MSIEHVRNRDLLFKVCFMFFINHILRILGIDEEVVEISPTEIITLENFKKPKIFDNFLDFSAITKSGKILLFEFKKNALTKDDLKQAYGYFDRVHCKKKGPVQLIIITISDKSKITEYNELDITFHPKIVKTKKINKQEDLSTIRDKFKNGVKLTSYECSLLIALPLFQLDESESKITEEICRNIKENKHCIPEEELDEIVLAMYLNIIEYVDVENQKELMEMIGLAEKSEGVIAQLRNGGERNIINRMLRKYSIDEVSRILEIEKATLLSIIQK